MRTIFCMLLEFGPAARHQLTKVIIATENRILKKMNTLYSTHTMGHAYYSKQEISLNHKPQTSRPGSYRYTVKTYDKRRRTIQILRWKRFSEIFRFFPRKRIAAAALKRCRVVWRKTRQNLWRSYRVDSVTDKSFLDLTKNSRGSVNRVKSIWRSMFLRGPALLVWFQSLVAEASIWKNRLNCRTSEQNFRDGGPWLNQAPIIRIHFVWLGKYWRI